ncbi:MAG TPA: PEFG-CTERM sorting domain-containing protein [Nitrosopumilaceae archaeon]|nr:PEFG-CTERM sorting domain-containing protein [Nitrosopumilaceae archaeon]
MNTRTSYVAIAIIAAVLATSTSAVFAQGFYDELACPDCPDQDIIMKKEESAQADIPIRVWTDKAVYDHKSTIAIEGSVAGVRPGTEVGLVVIGPPPFNNIVAVDQLQIGSDGKYKTMLSTAGDAWKYDGTYTIKVTYGNQQINNKALVQLTGGTVSGGQCAPGELTAKIGLSNYCIPYSITGGTVTSASINQKTTSLMINVNTSSDGTITLHIPRSVLDTKSSTDPLFVLVDGEETDSEESVTATTRTVTIMFPDGAEEIEIIGTFAIPEFGAIAALILAVAIISIIAVSSRTRLNVLPKY